MTNLEKFIRDVPDFPKSGIIFKDITPLLADVEALRSSVEQLVEPFADKGVEIVAGIESRGFIFGSLAADRLGAGFVPVRKPGKLPCKTIREDYQLEYGSDAVEIHADAVKTGQNVLMIDDLLATGGTMAAACKLVKRLGGNIVGVAFVIELLFLDGVKKLAPFDVHSLIRVSGE